MKNITLYTIATLFSLFCAAQSKVDSSIFSNIDSVDYTTPLTFTSDLVMRITTTPRYDTVQVTMLITECDTCNTKAMRGYVIRQLNPYYGDRMPMYGTGGVSYSGYDDWIETIGYIDNKKRPLAENITVWNCKIK